MVLFEVLSMQCKVDANSQRYLWPIRGVMKALNDTVRCFLQENFSYAETSPEKDELSGLLLNGHVSPDRGPPTTATPTKHHKHSGKAEATKTPPYTGKHKQQTLDTIIPWPSSYEGYDHPFKTVLEKNQEKECAQLKQKLLNSYGFTNGYADAQSDAHTTTDSDVTSQEDSDVITTTTTPLVAMAPINNVDVSRDALKTRGNHNNNAVMDAPQLSPRSAKIEAIRRKRGRKSKRDLEILAQAKAADRIRLREVKKRKSKFFKETTNNVDQVEDNQPEVMPKPKLPAHAKNVIDNRTLDAMSKREVPLNKLKSSVNSYFGAADRLRQGEKFTVVAKRINSEGKVQYLVEWHGALTCPATNSSLKR